MKRKWKKGLAVLLVGVLLAGTLPQMSYPKNARAAEKEWPGNPYKKNPNDRFTTFDCVYFGHYWYYDTDGNVNQSDAKEPIKWRVLSVDESGDAFLMADRIVDTQPYNKTNKSGVTWENCTLRSWLNGYGIEENGEEDYRGGNSFFDNAFNDEEKNAILKPKVENGDDPDEEVINDKVYLLSISEVTNPAYGFSASKSSDYSREADSTDYANSVFSWLTDYWYLRSMVDKGSSATPIATLIDGGYGTVEENIDRISVASAMGVRPVLHLNLKDENVWEPACPVQGKHIVLHRSFGPWHSDPLWKDYHEHICADETCVRLDPYNSSDRESCSGGTAGYTKKAICTTCGGEYGALLTDNTPPTGKVSAGTDQWDDVLTDFTFELFFNESKDVTISAEDGESGVASISYYLTDRKLTKEALIDIEDWQPTDADYKEEEDWKPTDTVTVTIEPDTECILYAKIIDGVGNTTYLSSDGMVFDGTAPKIEGVEDKGTYCASQDVTVKVTDKYLDSVTLDGKNIGLTGSTCTFTISGEASQHTITASDKAGNHKTVTVTMNKDHIFGDWEENAGKNRSKTCEVCGEKYTETDEERVKAARDIVEEFLGSLSATEDMEEDDIRQKVEEKLASEGFSDVTVTVDDFHKKEASYQEEGSIRGHVTLEVGEASEGVDFDRPLENSRQRMQKAREVVEKALSEMSVSNTTTAEDIQKVIDAALQEAGLADVTATVEDMHLTEATLESEGQITGNVTIEQDGVTDVVEIDKKIPPKGNGGTVGKDSQSEGDAPKGNLPMAEEDLADAVFDDEDRRQLESGKDITLLLTIADLQEDISEEDEQKIEEAASYYTVGQYMDINLNKIVKVNDIPEGEPTKITNTKEPIAVRIEVPDSLKGEAYREYAIVRLHDGAAVLLEDIDTDPDTITIMTDRFSTYAIVYTEITDAERVAGARDVIEEVLENLVVTNDTTRESLEKQLQDALNERGYGDVDVAIEDFEKEEAATDREGTVKGTVTVSKGEENDHMSLDKSIDKLPEEEPSATPEVTPSATPEVKPSATPEVTASATPEVTPSATPEVTPSPTPEVTASPTPEVTPSPTPEVTPSPTPEVTASPTPEASASATPEVTPSATPQVTVSPAPADGANQNKVGLIAELKVTQKGKKIKVKWGKAKDADGYQVYVKYCGKKFPKKPTRTIKNASVTRAKIAKLNGKKLNLKKNFKVYVAAYKIIDGKKVVIKKTMIGHIVGKGNNKYTNTKKVKVSKNKYTLNIGKTAKIKAKAVRVDKKKRELPDAHGRKFRYRSVNTGVAKVSKKGKITAVGRGTCHVYVFAKNGCAKKVKVTVK